MPDTSKPRHICLISGGKDSSALALYLRDTQPNLDVEYVFCDTHKELPETYEFLVRLEAYLGRPVIRLNPAEGDRAFDYWLRQYRGFLPSANARWCTRQLKIIPFERFIGEQTCYLYVGIRADERREGYISTKSSITPVFPFKEDDMRKDDIERLLADAGVGMPDYYQWRSRSGCYFCFYQRRIEWVGLRERHSDLFELAKAYEKPEEGFTWTERESLSELERPERMAQIRQEDEERRERRKRRRRRRPACLAEAFAPDDVDPEEETGCLICHL